MASRHGGRGGLGKTSRPTFSKTVQEKEGENALEVYSKRSSLAALLKKLDSPFSKACDFCMSSTRVAYGNKLFLVNFFKKCYCF